MQVPPNRRVLSSIKGKAMAWTYPCPSISLQYSELNRGTVQGTVPMCISSISISLPTGQAATAGLILGTKAGGIWPLLLAIEMPCKGAQRYYSQERDLSIPFPNTYMSPTRRLPNRPVLVLPISRWEGATTGRCYLALSAAGKLAVRSSPIPASNLLVLCVRNAATLARNSYMYVCMYSSLQCRQPPATSQRLHPVVQNVLVAACGSSWLVGRNAALRPHATHESRRSIHSFTDDRNRSHFNTDACIAAWRWADATVPARQAVAKLLLCVALLAATT